MTDVAALLQPDRGQPATALHLVDKKGFEAWLKASRSGCGRRQAQGFKGEGLPARHPARRAATNGRPCSASPMSTSSAPGASPRRPRACPKASIGSPGGTRAGGAGLAARPVSLRPLQEGAEAEGSARAADRRAGADRGGGADRRGDLPGPRPGQHPGRRPRPGRTAGGGGAVAEGGGVKLKVTSGAKLAERLSDGPRGRRGRDRGAGAAADRARMGRPAPSRASPSSARASASISGGLDIKPSAGMRLMKKDMGGAAHALALAQLVMKRTLPVRLHLLVPAVENAVSAAAARPGDVLRSRKGLTVEIGNTDAEGPADPRRRADPRGRARARADPRLRHPDRRGAGRAGAGPARSVRQ